MQISEQDIAQRASLRKSSFWLNAADRSIPRIVYASNRPQH
jgi:hypothetical protein